MPGVKLCNVSKCMDDGSGIEVTWRGHHESGGQRKGGFERMDHPARNI